MIDADHQAQGPARETGTGSPLTRRAFVGRATAAVVGVSAGSSVLAYGARAATRARIGTRATGVTILNILPPQLGYAAEYMADIRGYFAKAGLEVKTETSRGSAPAIQALLSGQGLMTSIGAMETIIHGANEGAPLVSIAIREHRAPVALVSSKDKPLTTPKALVGKMIGIPSAGGTSELTLNTLLKKSNIPIDQVRRQVTGFSPGTFELIKQGRIDGFIIGATQMGQFKILIPDSVFLEFGKFVADGYGYVTTPDQIRQNRATMRLYLQSVRRSMLDIIADKPKGYATTISTLKDHYDFQELQDDRVARAWIDYLVGGWLYQGPEWVLRPTPKRFRQIYNQLVDIGVVKAGLNSNQWINTTVAFYPGAKTALGKKTKKKK
jgi:NitT/TauT family transport system substrate-binding protein